MPKRRRNTIFDATHFYRRPNSSTIFARDRLGRYNCYTVDANSGEVSILPAGMFTLPPIYGRVNFANNVRFTASTRGQSTLKNSYIGSSHKLKPAQGWMLLPTFRCYSRRTTNQGMDTAMQNLTGAKRSALAYATWVSGRNANAGLDVTLPWEWCHLVAHSLGGADNAGNIVAAVKGNNSEQLAIESALHMYRSEDQFELKVTASLMNNGDGKHVGDVIRYKIRCSAGGSDFEQYLDCLNAPDPSEIHYYGLLEAVAKWANNKLVAISDALNKVSTAERNLIKDFIDENK